MSKTTILYFQDTAIQIRKNGKNVSPIALEVRMNKQIRLIKTGLYLSKDDFAKARVSKATAFDKIEDAWEDEIKIAKIKMETAKMRVYQLIEYLPKLSIEAELFSKILDNTKDISEPRAPFNIMQIICQFFKMDVQSPLQNEGDPFMLPLQKLIPVYLKINKAEKDFLYPLPIIPASAN